MVLVVAGAGACTSAVTVADAAVAVARCYSLLSVSGVQLSLFNFLLTILDPPTTL